jgi:hypothetical protein
MKRLLTLLTLALCFGLAFSASALGAFDLKELDVSFEDKDENLILQAGSHPFQMSTNLGVTTVSTPEGEVPEGEMRNLTIEQIPGLIGSQTAVPTCDQADFSNRNEGRPACPNETAVGYTAAEVEFDVIPPGGADVFYHVAVYNLDPPPGVAAQLGFVVLNVPVTIDITVAPKPPYSLVAQLKNVPQAILLYRSKVVLWGNPPSEDHDPLRGTCLGEVGNATPEPVSEGNCPVDLAEKAFLTLPRACGEPLPTLFSAVSWKEELADGTAFTHDETEPKGIEGCEELGFDAGIDAQPTTTSASSPSGLNFGLDVFDPGLTDPDELANSDIRKVIATLPQGMALNPSAANGLQACTRSQYEAEGLQWSPLAGCPQASKVGSVEVQTPLLKETLRGDLYVASQDDNPFGTLFALYMVIRSERYGILIKQAGRIDPDPKTGQLTSTFDEIPQLPFADLILRFRGGPRAPLATPERCGIYTSTASFGLWAGGDLLSGASSSFETTSGPGGTPCPPAGLPFSPTLQGGAAERQAGAFSPFSMHLTRADGQQEISRLDATLPPGVLAKIAGLGRCSEAVITAAKGRSGRAELSSPSCPASARIGSIEAGAGLGSILSYVQGSLYLAGPYAGQPLSVVAVTPAVTGPFDLGTVLIRQALKLNPITAQAEVQGIGPDGAIPTVLKGVPLKLRDLRISIDRPGFTLNATSCEPEALQVKLFGAQNVAQLSDRYQASGCGALGYKPKLTLKLLGATKRGKFPSLRSTLIPRVGDANTGRAVVTMPPSVQIENAHINNPCTRVQFDAGACPKASILGKARAYSPLLDKPLEGPVYFRSNGGERELPDIVADLNGEFRVIQVGFIDTKGKRIRTTFANVPDASVSRFELNLAGGKRSLLVFNRNVCARKQRAKLALTGQNGRPHVTNQVIKTSCKGKKGRKGKGGRQKGLK